MLTLNATVNRAMQGVAIYCIQCSEIVWKKIINGLDQNETGHCKSNPFVSCCKDLKVAYHISTTITPSTRHHVPQWEMQITNLLDLGDIMWKHAKNGTIILL